MKLLSREMGDINLSAKREMVEMYVETLIRRNQERNEELATEEGATITNLPRPPQIKEPDKSSSTWNSTTATLPCYYIDEDDSLSLDSPSSDNDEESMATHPFPRSSDDGTVKAGPKSTAKSTKTLETSSRVSPDVQGGGDNQDFVVEPQNLTSEQDDSSTVGDSVVALPDCDVEASLTRVPSRPRKSADLEHGRRISQAYGLTWTDSYFDAPPVGKEVVPFVSVASTVSSVRGSPLAPDSATAPSNMNLVAVFDYDYKTVLRYKLKLKIWTLVGPVTVAILILIVFFTVPGIYNAGPTNPTIGSLTALRASLLAGTLLWSVVLCYGYYRIYKSTVQACHVAVLSNGIRIVHDDHLEARYLGVLLAAFHVFDKWMLVPNRTETVRDAAMCLPCKFKMETMDGPDSHTTCFSLVPLRCWFRFRFI